MICPDCGYSPMAHFSGVTIAVGTVPVKDLSGWRCPECDAYLFDPDSTERYAAAGDEQVLRDRGDRG